MPAVTEDTVTAWAHCPQARCPGTTQEEVEATRRETIHTYRDRGGDMPGVESSYVELVFADEDRAACPHCGRVRDLSDSPRRSYAPLSGHDPMGLLGAPQFDARKQAEHRAELQSKGVDPDKQALEQQNEALLKRLAELEAKVDKE